VWSDVRPVLRAVWPPEDLQLALDDPNGFIGSLSKRGPPVSRLWAITRARPKIEPLLVEDDVQWEDMKSVLDAFDTDKQINVAFDTPEKYLIDMRKKSAGVPAKYWLIAKLRALLVHLLPNGIPWLDLVPVLEEIETLRELRDFLESTDLLMWKLLNGGEWPATKKFRIVRRRPSVEPLLPEGIRWEEYYQMLIVIEPDPDDHRDSLDYACTHVSWYTDRLKMNSASQAALMWMICRLHPILQDGLWTQGNEWSEAVPMLKEMEMVYDLEPALKDPKNLLQKLACGLDRTSPSAT